MEQKAADAAVRRCILRVEDGADPLEAIPDTVVELKAFLARPQEPVTNSPAYGAFRASLVDRILTEKLTPSQAADILVAEGFGLMCSYEIAKYREWGNRWGGDIPHGAMIWHTRNHRLEPWPHDGLVRW